MKKLPLSSMYFKEMIEGNYVYVDKTDIIADLVSIPKGQLFFSRPRCFGKSLLLSTIEEIFNGNPDTFKGLKIMDSGYEFKRHPVVNLDMSLDSRSPEKLEMDLLFKLNKIASQEDLRIQEQSPRASLEALIDALYEKFDKTCVVILVDEYDYPVSSHLDDQDLASDNYDLLINFYGAIKTAAQAGKVHFVFVTSVTCYVDPGMSAGLNCLLDISFRPKYASLCGFTHDELDPYFSDFYPPVLEIMTQKGILPPQTTVTDLKQKIIDYYDGYSFDGKTRVLNPFSITRFLEARKFSNFWSNTYSSKGFLSAIIGKSPLSFLPGHKMQFDANHFYRAPSIDGPHSALSLFHAGYLTIDSISRGTKRGYYNLIYPNKVLEGDYYKLLSEALLSSQGKDKTEEADIFQEAVLSRDAPILEDIIFAFFDGVTRKDYVRMDKSFYPSLFWVYANGLFNTTKMEEWMEEPGSLGDPGVIVELANNVYAVISIKYGHPDVSKLKNVAENKTASADDDYVEERLNTLSLSALEDIEEKGYGHKYRITGNTVIDIGLGIYGRNQVKIAFQKPLY